ncbi:MAG TPA: D-glucuronyl C5-epimerase family protein [Anaerolineae bacterium]|nr:D-glucuronyl C5-epimerase family protein [Anaerolineae bacterium]
MKKESRIPEGLTLRGARLDHYYHDFTYELAIARPMNAAGVPLLDYGYPLGARSFPILTGAYALALHERFLCTNDSAFKQKFLAVADCLVERQGASRTGFGWENELPNFKYWMMPPWISGMSQGLNLSALLRAYELAPKASYMESATRAIRSFEQGAPEGGCREVGAQGDVWYEETPSTAPTGSAHILNGFIFALWGLYDYVRATQDARAQELLDEGLATLRNRAAQYDTGYWTRYALTPRNYLATRFYHQVHIDGMIIFHALTEEARFADWAKRWTAYTTNRICLARWRVTFRVFRVIYKLQRARTLWRLV